MLGLGLIQVINLFLIFHCNEQPLLSLDLVYFSTFDLRLWQTQPPQPLQHPFTAAGSRFAQPATDGTGRRTHVVYDKTAMVAEMVQLGCDLVTGVWEKWGGNRDGDSGGRGGVPGGVLKRPSYVYAFTRGIRVRYRYSLYRGRKTIEKQTANVKSL